MKKDYPDELTEKMHSEFSISKSKEIFLRAGCVWEILSFKNNPTRSDIEKECKCYGISYQDAIRYRNEWERMKTSKR